MQGLSGLSGLSGMGRVSEVPPSSPSNLLLWLKADAGTFQDSTKLIAASADNDPIGAWADQSGGGLDFTQATAGKRPTLKLSIQNGKPVIRFTTASSTTLAGTLNALAGASAFTLFMVVSTSVPSANQRALSGDNNKLLVQWSGSSLLTRVDGSNIYNGPSWTTTSFRQIVVVYDGSQSGNENRLKLNVDGAWAPHTFTGTIPATTAAGGTFAIGSSSNGAANFLGGDIGEIIIYSSALTEQERLGVEEYLRSRWGTG